MKGMGVFHFRAWFCIARHTMHIFCLITLGAPLVNGKNNLYHILQFLTMQFLRNKQSPKKNVEQSIHLNIINVIILCWNFP